MMKGRWRSREVELEVEDGAASSASRRMWATMRRESETNQKLTAVESLEVRIEVEGQVEVWLRQVLERGP